MLLGPRVQLALLSPLPSAAGKSAIMGHVSDAEAQA